MPERWLLMRQNRTLIFIDLKIFEPMSVIADTLCLMRLMFCMLLCMSSFDDMWYMCDAMDCMLRVFDPGSLLVVRVGNLNELSKR